MTTKRDLPLSQTGETLPVGLSWSGHPVGFALLTTPSQQVAAYYDADRVLTVASRPRDSADWETLRLPERVGWDSHNHLVLGRDAGGFLHLSGNMHADPLVYFRSREPDAIRTLERAAMTGRQEDQVTYPEFFTGPGGALCFGYRHGSSGRGDQIYNHYDPAEKRWDRLTAGALVSGGGVRNAYLDGPRRAPDGTFHLCWVWRDTPDCATNHTLCHALSRDLVHWETASGQSLALPLTVDHPCVVDPVPPGRGLINGNARLGFDHQNRVVISYHKLDSGGFTQIFHARHEKGRWISRPATAWDWAWLPQGEGTILPEIRIFPVSPALDGTLAHRVWTRREGHVDWRLDPATLRPLSVRPPVDAALRSLDRASRDGLRVNWAGDSGHLGNLVPPFALRWESLPENRDASPERPLPPAGRLDVVRTAASPRPFWEIPSFP